MRKKEKSILNYIGPVLLLGMILYFSYTVVFPHKNKTVKDLVTDDNLEVLENRSVDNIIKEYKKTLGQKVREISKNEPKTEIVGEIICDEEIDEIIINSLRGMCSKESHSIQIIDFGGPKLLQKKFSRESLGHTRRRHAVMIQEFPNGNAQSIALVRKEKLLWLNEDCSIAKFEAITNSIAYGKLFNSYVPPNFDLSVREIFTINKSGHIIEEQFGMIHGKTKLGHKTFGISASTLPPYEMGKGKLYRKVMDVPEDAPDIIRKDPPWIEIVLSERVLFDDHEAILVNSNLLFYEEISVTTPRLPERKGLLSKCKAEYSYYIAVDSGEVLWGENRITIVESDLPGLDGVTSIYREESD